jgi:hypothetical protein
MSDYKELGRRIGEIVQKKNVAYGDSVGRSAYILEVFYPGGIRPDQYRDVMLLTRIIDKLSRIAERGPDGQDLGGESPYSDLAGYAILGWAMDEETAAEAEPATEAPGVDKHGGTEEGGADTQAAGVKILRIGGPSATGSISSGSQDSVTVGGGPHGSGSSET